MISPVTAPVIRSFPSTGRRPGRSTVTPRVTALPVSMRRITGSTVRKRTVLSTSPSTPTGRSTGSCFRTCRNHSAGTWPLRHTASHRIPERKNPGKILQASPWGPGPPRSLSAGKRRGPAAEPDPSVLFSVCLCAFIPRSTSCNHNPDRKTLLRERRAGGPAHLAPASA